MNNNINTAIEFARNNPDSEYASELRRRIESGSLNNELQTAGLNQYITKQTQTSQEPNALSQIAKFGRGLAGDIIQPFESLGKTTKAGVESVGSYLGNKDEYNQAGMGLKDVYQASLYKNNQDKTLTGTISGGEVEAPARDITTGEGIEQTVGDIGEGILTVATGGSAGSLTKGAAKTSVKNITENVAKTGYKEAITTGAKIGAGYGATGAMQEGKNLIDTTKEAAGGALFGAGLGLAGKAIAQGISKTGGLSNTIKNVKDTKTKTFALDLVSPKQTEAIKVQALKEGRVSEQGLLNASKILPSKREIELADIVKDVVSTKKSVTQNLDLIGNKVDEINTGVKAFVKANKSPFNTTQLTSQLNKGKNELNLIFAGDKQAEKTYNAVVKEFIKNVKNKDTYGLLEARQTFDNIPAIKKLLSSQGLGENVKKEIVLTVRGKANEYVASLLPKGNKFREALLNEHKMLEAMQNIAEKNTKSIGLNKLQELTVKYPILKNIVAGLTAGLGLGATGVGASLIGSSD